MKHILKLLFLLAFAGSAFAQLQVPGMLDRSFGRRGVVTELPAAGVNYKIYEVLTQPDGKMIAVGRIVLSSSRRMFMLVRYNRNGTRDWTFGNQGMSAIWFGMDVFATSAALQPDGKIIVAGVTSPNAYADFAMARYLPDGDLDMSFGQGGIVTTDTSTFDVTAEEWAEKVFVLPDGRMLLVGTRQARSNFTYEQLPASMMVARYLPDGSLDPSYGIGGKSIIPMEL